MKNKGQALVEFIITVPVLLIILTSIADYGNIIYQKYQLENTLSTVVKLYENNNVEQIEKIVTDSNLEYNAIDENGMKHLSLSKKIKVISPGINVILGNPYKITVDRMVYNE